MSEWRRHVIPPPAGHAAWTDGSLLISWMMLQVADLQPITGTLCSAHWLAQDSIGTWYMYEFKPKRLREEWHFSRTPPGACQYIAHMHCDTSWKDTLLRIKKPAGEAG